MEPAGTPRWWVDLTVYEWIMGKRYQVGRSFRLTQDQYEALDESVRAQTPEGLAKASLPGNASTAPIRFSRLIEHAATAAADVLRKPDEVWAYAGPIRMPYYQPQSASYMRQVRRLLETGVLVRDPRDIRQRNPEELFRPGPRWQEALRAGGASRHNTMRQIVAAAPLGEQAKTKTGAMPRSSKAPTRPTRKGS